MSGRICGKKDLGKVKFTYFYRLKMSVSGGAIGHRNILSRLKDVKIGT